MLLFHINQPPSNSSMSHHFIFALIIFGILQIQSCIPVSNEPSSANPEFSYSMQDSLVQHIRSESEQGHLNAIVPYLRHEKPAYRYTAALGLASFAEQTALDSLMPLLADPSLEVATMAAFALGQSKDKNRETALINAFRQPDSVVNVYGLNMRIMEAAGKVGSTATLKNLATISTYRPEDTLLLEGQTRGIYQFMLRGETLPEGTAKMVALATDPSIPNSARLLAASYLARIKEADLSLNADVLLTTYQNETHFPIKLALAIAAGKSKNDAVREALMQDFTTVTDHRLRCNILRGLSFYPYTAIKDHLVAALKDEHPQVVEVATTLIGEKVEDADLNNLAQLAKINFSPLVRANLIGAYLKSAGYSYAIGRNARSGDLRNLYLQQTDPVIKAQMAKNFAFDDGQTAFLAAEAQKATEPILRTALYSTLIQSLQDKKVRQPATLAKAMLPQLILGLQLVDPSIMELVCDALLTEGHPLFASWENKTIFQDLLNNTSAETNPDLYDKLGAVMAKLNGQPKPTPSPKQYAQIDWSKVLGSDQKTVVMTTNKGPVEIQLWPHLAPATISRFITLIEQKFYDGRIFHRVVPNFVSQTGCPRGDGYGSAPGYIRSELTPASYDQEGLIGMASSGRHTESSQFFITHSPALHLDGNYTIFGRVTKGLENVLAIQVGDRIESITIR